LCILLKGRVLLKVFGNILLGLLILVAVAIAVVYTMGAFLPLNHTASISGVVHAPPEKVFALITNLRRQPKWRTGLQRVKMLPPVDGHDQWMEYMAHNQKMTYVALDTEPPTKRVVKSSVEGDAFGGTWTFELTSNGSDATNVQITEDCYLRPRIFRLLMVHVFGATSTMNQYLMDLQAAVNKQ
jgi:uncharacterized membrane protein